MALKKAGYKQQWDDTSFIWDTSIAESWDRSVIVTYPSWDPFVSPFEHSRGKMRSPLGLKYQVPPPTSPHFPFAPLLFSFYKKSGSGPQHFFISSSPPKPTHNLITNLSLFLFQDISKVSKWKRILNDYHSVSAIMIGPGMAFSITGKKGVGKETLIKPLQGTWPTRPILIILIVQSLVCYNYPL